MPVVVNGIRHNSQAMVFPGWPPDGVQPWLLELRPPEWKSLLGEILCPGRQVTLALLCVGIDGACHGWASTIMPSTSLTLGNI